MKAFIFICLVAAALAEPESDAGIVYSSAYGLPTTAYTGLYPYNTYTSGYLPYAGYTGYTGVIPNAYTYGSTFYSHLLKKREADAESKPLTILPYANNWAYNYAVNPHFYSGIPQVAYTVPKVAYTAPTVYSSPVVSYVNPHLTAKSQVSPGAINTVKNAHLPAAIPAVANAYAGAGRYEAVSGGVVHRARRDADAEADPYVLYRNFGYAPSYYNGVYRSAYTYPSVYNNVYGYNNIYGYNTLGYKYLF